MKVIEHSFRVLALALCIGFGIAQAPVLAADIVDTLKDRHNFKVLNLVLDASGMTTTLKSKGPYTLFAPNDEAFAKLPSGTIEALVQPQNKKLLRALIAYHVLPRKTLKAWRIVEVRNFDITTLEGSTAELDTKNGRLAIEDAAITQADVMADNGVVHVIDAVMLPPRLKRAIRRRRR